MQVDKVTTWGIAKFYAEASYTNITPSTVYAAKPSSSWTSEVKRNARCCTQAVADCQSATIEALGCNSKLLCSDMDTSAESCATETAICPIAICRKGSFEALAVRLVKTSSAQGYTECCKA